MRIRSSSLALVELSATLRITGKGEDQTELYHHYLSTFPGFELLIVETTEEKFLIPCDVFRPTGTELEAQRDAADLPRLGGERRPYHPTDSNYSDWCSE